MTRVSSVSIFPQSLHVDLAMTLPYALYCGRSSQGYIERVSVYLQTQKLLNLIVEKLRCHVQNCGEAFLVGFTWGRAVWWLCIRWKVHPTTLVIFPSFPIGMWCTIFSVVSNWHKWLEAFATKFVLNDIMPCYFNCNWTIFQHPFTSTPPWSFLAWFRIVPSAYKP